MAHFDALTGLPNRVLFYDRLNKSLSHAKRNNNTFALLFMDLNKFKKVNDNFGHNAGDILLKMIAKRFSHCLREVDTVARLGGDEFAIILTSINESQNAAFVSQRIIACFEKPFFVRKDIECNIGISIGITVYPSDGHDADTLIKNADITMYRAKEKGGNSYQFYNSEMNNTVTGNITIENKL